MNITELKAKAYDLLAKREAYLKAANDLLEEIQKVNQEIMNLMKDIKKEE